MRVIDPGHYYDLNVLDDGTGLVSHQLQFVKREGEGFPGNVGSYPGTIIQELLRASIDRINYVDKQIPDYRNSMVIRHLRRALYLLEHRAAERHGTALAVDVNKIETYPVGPTGHIFDAQEVSVGTV